MTRLANPTRTSWTPRQRGRRWPGRRAWRHRGPWRAAGRPTRRVGGFGGALDRCVGQPGTHQVVQRDHRGDGLAANATRVARRISADAVARARRGALVRVSRLRRREECRHRDRESPGRQRVHLPLVAGVEHADARANRSHEGDAVADAAPAAPARRSAPGRPVAAEGAAARTRRRRNSSPSPASRRRAAVDAAASSERGAARGRGEGRRCGHARTSASAAGARPAPPHTREARAVSRCPPASSENSATARPSRIKAAAGVPPPRLAARASRRGGQDGERLDGGRRRGPSRSSDLT